MNIVILGLAITSSWGNGHATTYRSLVKGLHRRGHHVTFLERDVPWYADNRDAAQLPFCDTHLYASIEDLQARYTPLVRAADAVIVGSYVQDGVRVIDWVLEHAGAVRAFYDIDTPVTIAALGSDRCEYLKARQIPAFDLMLSFTGGPILDLLQSQYGARRALPLYCSVDVDHYSPHAVRKDVDLGYMGTYSADRQPALETLLNVPARELPEQRFMVVGAQYPDSLTWPANVERVVHLAPQHHAEFYSRQRFTLNLTRSDMRAAGYSPSVRLFEAAACGTPIISDEWAGIETILQPGAEILLANAAEQVIRCLREMSDAERDRVARAARQRVLEAHTSAKRAQELESYIEGVSARCSVEVSARAQQFPRASAGATF